MKRKGRRERKGETSIGFTGFEVNIPDPARASPQAWAVLKPCSTHSPTRHCPPPPAVLIPGLRPSLGAWLESGDLLR